MKHILSLIFLLSAYPIFGQHNIDSNNRVTNFNFETNFNFVGTFDYDLLRKVGKDHRYNTKVLIRIGNQGDGRLVIYFQKKTTLYVDYCIKTENNYYFYLKNGKEAILYVDKFNNVSGFVLKKDDNTAIIFF